MKMNTNKIIKAPFSDKRIEELHLHIIKKTRDKAIELQIPMGSVVGVLENVKHEIQHEFQPIDSGMIDY